MYITHTTCIFILSHYAYVFILSHYAGDVMCVYNTVSTVAFKIANGVVGCGEITRSCQRMLKME